MSTNRIHSQRDDIKSLTVYVINLDRSTERMRNIDLQLRQLCLAYERISAVDGHAATAAQKASLDTAQYLRKHGKTPIPGELGCYLSHAKAIEQFLGGSKQFALILEDDAILEQDLPLALIGLIDKKDYWDMVKLSGVHGGSPIRLSALSSTQQMCILMTKCTGSSAYLINKIAAKAYSTGLLPMYLPYDHEFDKGWHYGIKVRAVQPFPVSHNITTGSDIEGPLPRGKLPFNQRWTTHSYRLRTEFSRLLYCISSILRAKIKARKKAT